MEKELNVSTLLTEKQQEDFIKALGLTFSKLRTEKRINQEEMASAVGVSRNHISTMERSSAKSRMSIVVFYNYCKTLGVSADEVFRLMGEEYCLTESQSELKFIKPIEISVKDSNKVSFDNAMPRVVRYAQATETQAEQKSLEELRLENAILKQKLESIGAILGIPVVCNAK